MKLPRPPDDMPGQLHGRGLTDARAIIAAMTTCRWCGMELRLVAGFKCCPGCDLTRIK